MTAATGRTDAGHWAPELRVCVVGDDLVAGVGDPRSLGWVGRVGARTPRTESAVTLFGLGVPGETTTGLLARWREETGRRFAGGDPASFRLVVGLGLADLDEPLSLARSRLNVANILDECGARGLPVLVVGPPPSRLLTGTQQDAQVQADREAELSDAFADVCLRRGIGYVDCWTPLVQHEDWLTDLAAGDGRRPGQVGYGLIAWLVLHNGWAHWLGVADG